MREAPVGHQCVQCVRDGSKSVRQPRTAFGGQVSATPVVTYALIAVNVVMYLIELASPGVIGQLSIFGEGIAAGQWYRLITGSFLHLLPSQGLLGITHITFNMVALWILGRPVEEALGKLRFGVLYLVSALGGSVLVFLIAPEVPAVGASGAIFGLAAAFFVISRRLRRATGYAARLLIFYVLWLAISAGVTSWEGHLGGLLSGGALTLAYAYAPARRRTVIQAGAVAALLVLAIALVVLKSSQLGHGA
jgi:membrane associated rhomboid family serine protease